MNFIRTIFGFILAIALVTFAVANRQGATLIYSPIHDPLEVPLYLITLIFMALGFLLGGFTVWANGDKSRRSNRQQRKTIKDLEKELKKIEDTDPKFNQPPSDFFPALPQKSEKTALLESKNSSIKQG